jgi:nucleoid-associated protein YgaU
MVRLRRLPATPGEPRTVKASDQPDGLAEALYADATRYWRIADANTELEAAALTRRPGRVILVPKG